MLKKAFDTSSLTNVTKRTFNMAPLAVSIDRRGVQGDGLIEPVPLYNKSKNEKVIEGGNNAFITLGRDRPGEAGSGYGHETGAGTIDIVAGRVSKDIQVAQVNNKTLKQQALYVDNNIAADASRIYVSQKTDVDTNFNIKAGSVGSSMGRAAVAIKSDAVRIIGREGIKIVTKTDKQNSFGAKIRTVPSIDIIAGNDDSNIQSVVKGETSREQIANILKKIDDLNSVLDSFMTYQVEYNAQIASHTHPDPMLQFLGIGAYGNPYALINGETPFSPSLLAAGTKATACQLITSKKDGIMNKLGLATAEMTSVTAFGTKEPSSGRVKVS